MKKAFCDICGEEIKGELYGELHFYHYRTGTPIHPENRIMPMDYDLCTHCTGEVFQKIEKIKKGE